MRIIAITIFTLLLFPFGLHAQNSPQSQSDKQEGRSVSPDPDAARLVTSDIANFWRAYDRATPDDDLIVFRNEYLRKGSYGLQ
ncbi:MAG TPA: hypothetical protein VNO70_01570, partial [Blastocatellia bacterium]|nr:hypothetical protein [Blastocatellia bacterium]